jgi:hypothetical protein
MDYNKTLRRLHYAAECLAHIELTELTIGLSGAALTGNPILPSILNSTLISTGIGLYGGLMFSPETNGLPHLLSLKKDFYHTFKFHLKRSLLFGYSSNVLLRLFSSMSPISFVSQFFISTIGSGVLSGIVQAVDMRQKNISEKQHEVMEDKTTRLSR